MSSLEKTPVADAVGRLSESALGPGDSDSRPTAQEDDRETPPTAEPRPALSRFLRGLLLALGAWNT